MSAGDRRSSARRYLFVILSPLCLLVSSDSPAGQQTSLFSADGYRIDAFHSPVPDSVPGARTVHTEEVRRLTESTGRRPVLIDVLPSPPKPDGLGPSALWLPPTRYNIPGSVWLPNVGYGRISDDLDRYFRANLQRLTDYDPSRPVVIYCLDDCWMSWNAARRAAEYGYREVLWFPEGTDGWAAAQLPLVESTPLPMP